MPTFLVTLATGHQGGATARQLVQAGHTVNALVRNKDSAAALALAELDVNLYQSTLEDRGVIQAAATGVTGIFLNLVLNPQDEEAELRATKTVLEAARDSGTVTTIVLSTAFHTGRHHEWTSRNPNYPLAAYFASKAMCEAAVLSSGFPHIVILRPAWLMHNNVATHSVVHFPELATERTLATAYKRQTRMPYFDPEDVGKFAAAALLKPEKHSGKQIELGNENLTIEDAAAIMGLVAGVEVKVRYRSSEEIIEFNSKVPTQRFHVLANEEDLEIKQGSLDEYGIRLTTFEEYLERESDALGKALGL